MSQKKMKNIKKERKKILNKGNVRSKERKNESRTDMRKCQIEKKKRKNVNRSLTEIKDSSHQYEINDVRNAMKQTLFTDN